jgi:hypothetical protein
MSFLFSKLHVSALFNGPSSGLYQQIYNCKLVMLRDLVLLAEHMALHTDIAAALHIIMPYVNHVIQDLVTLQTYDCLQTSLDISLMIAH